MQRLLWTFASLIFLLALFNHRLHITISTSLFLVLIFTLITTVTFCKYYEPFVRNILINSLWNFIYWRVEIWKFFKQYIYSLGDINQDNILNVLDIISLIDLILSQDTNDYPLADLNGDGEVNVIDVVSLVNIILSN